MHLRTNCDCSAKEFLLEVPGSPGELSGPGLIQFRWSLSSSASELVKGGEKLGRVIRLLDRGADERQGIGGSGGAATECGGDVGHLFHSQETDDQIAQSGHHLRG